MTRRRNRYLLGLWLARWGFAVMVAAASIIGLIVALTVTPPTEVPDVALEASPVFRVEVGAAVFFGLYVATMALALALQNRGFTEIGSGGVRAQDLMTVSQEVVSQEVSMELLAEIIDEMHDLRLLREER